jgi:Lon-like protease
MARPDIQAAAVVTSVSDMNDNSVMPRPLPPPSPSPDLPPAPPRVRPATKRWAVVVAVLGLFVIAVPLVAAILPSEWFIEKTDCAEYAPRETAEDPVVCVRQGEPEPVKYAVVPSAAQPVQPRVQINGAEQFPTDGDTYFVTITTPELSLLDWFVVRNNGATSVRSSQDLYGDQGRQETIQQGQQMMRNAKQTAEYVAFKTAGYEPTLEPGDVIIDQMLCIEFDDDGACVQEAPSSDVLDPGDKLLSVDGTEISTVDDLGVILEGKQPGDRVTVVYERDGEEFTDEIEVTSDPDDPTRTLVGFIPVDTSTVALPEGMSVDIDTGAIGGPSAGLAFTLTLVDELTPGALTGGNDVAVTGAIDLNGRVGAIGGLPSKASAVMQQGLKYFLVPTAQGEDDIAAARAVVGDRVEIIPVADIDEALAALERIGGDPMVPVGS